MIDDARRAELMHEYDARRSYFRAILDQVVPAEELEACLGEARAHYAEMIDEIPYAVRADHSMARFSNVTYPLLALYLASRKRGADAHAVGRAIHAAHPSARGGDGGNRMQNIRQEAEASQRNPTPGEFVFRVVPGDGVRSDYGIDVLSCAVCHAFARHDASALVPYMCALDDAMLAGSRRALRRTGTIALGADHCDFRFKQGGEPEPLAPRYPDQIRL